MNNLEKILIDLERYKALDRDAFYSHCIEQRLQQSLIQYYKSIDSIKQQISKKNVKKIIKHL